MARTAVRKRFAPWLALAVAAAAPVAFGGGCSRAEAPPEQLGQAQAAQFANGSFEVGTPPAAPPSWTVNTFLNPGVTNQTPQTYAGLNLGPGGTPFTVTIAGMGTTDPTLKTGLTYCKYGAQCALVNQLGKNQNVNQLSQTMTVGPADVDPADNAIHVRLVVAPILEFPTMHTAQQQPYFFVQVTNVTQKNAILYSNYNFSNQPGVPWQTVNTGGTTYLYTDWQLIDVSPGGTAINQGDMIELQLIAAGCSLGGHIGELYVDGVGTTVPGLFVSGSAPAQINPGNNLTYTLTYENGSPPVACSASLPCAGTESCVAGTCAETGVVLTFTTPPGTVYESFTAPPGMTCTTPLVGTAGTIKCTLTSPLPPGTSGVVTITVNVPTTTTGTLAEGNYNIASTQEAALLGNVIITQVGCTADVQCPAGDWCDVTLDICTPTLPAGTPIPSDPKHTPVIANVCTPAVGAIVCTSGVCDKNNECGYENGDGPCGTNNAFCQSNVCDSKDGNCGYENGDGPCTVANGPTVCRSKVCDPNDKLCGLANGDGPCVAGPTQVCRSGQCSKNLTCEPMGGCNVDADCAAGSWCFEMTHTCTPKLANGTQLPNDPGHVPTVDGMCSSGEATLVCVSGVCDTNQECGYLNGDGPCANGSVCQSGVCDPDKKCGYANGDGPCTAGNGSTVCRSGNCAVGSGTCEAPGGCKLDSDCTAGNWCNETTDTCTPTTPNGMPLPKDGDHTNPTLDGSCNTAAAMLTCTSGVCDPKDMLCGIANGDPGCSPGSDMKCRSGMCSTNGTCEPMGGCNVDADCTAGNWCNETANKCTPTTANGMPLPKDGDHTSPTLDGSCNTAAAMLTCTSGVCDTKDMLCGYANGDGPCDSTNGGTVCRSGLCGSGGTCVGCMMDSQCPSSAPVCNTTTGTCEQCATSADCSGQTPVCDTSNDTCVPCTGDNGGGMADACPTAGNPFCFLTGSMMGACGKCTTSSDCTGHTGNVCDTTSGLCTSGCTTDADCTAEQWCNATPPAIGQCVSKLPNGTPLPSMPTSVSTCSSTVGARVCQSGVCDKDNECGYANGDGPCSSADQCRNMTCNTTSMTCTKSGCQSDTDCPSGDYCNTTSSECSPKQPDGSKCSAADECTSNVCAQNQCGGAIIGSGGLLCAAQPERSESGTGAAAFGLLLAAMGLSRRRGRRSACSSEQAR